MKSNLLRPFALRRTVAITAAAVCAAAVHPTTWAAVWTGGGADNEYSTAANWDDNLSPSGADNSTQDINGAFTVERSVDSTSGRTFIKGGATMNIIGGSHDDQRSGANIFNFLGDSSAGMVNQSGGEYRIGHGLRVGVGGAPDGAYNLTGGSLDIYRGSNSKIESDNPGGRPSLEVGDTTGSGLFEISGGSLQTRAGVHIGPTGVFSVVGSTPTGISIGPSGSGDGSWIQHGMLKAAIDAGGVTPILIDDFDDAGGVVGEFKAGSLLDLSFDGVAPFAGTWTLMEIENTDIVDGGLALSDVTASGWNFSIDNSGANGLLTATYGVPEPASTMILVMAALAIGPRRRV